MAATARISRTSRCRLVLGLAVCACLAVSFFQLGRRWDDGQTNGGRPAGFVDPASFTAVGSVGTGTSAHVDARALMFAQLHFQRARYMTHISTDKPSYRPGEVVNVRAVLLSATTRAPLDASRRTAASGTIKGPKGDTVGELQLRSSDSTLGGAWTVPKDLPGGTYTLKITHHEDGWPPAEREFKVQEFSNPPLRLQLKFARDGYGPGDQVFASVVATRSAGGVAVGAVVSFNARVDGSLVATGSASPIDASGATDVSFALPAAITGGDGSLVVTVRDGGDQASVSKTLPILLSNLALEVYPEGGDLIAGLESRVYVQGSLPSGHPADFAAVIMEVDAVGRAGTVVATVDTQHEGRGVTTYFVPESDQRYELRVTRPASVRTTVPLPKVKPSGGVLTVTSGSVIAASQPISIRVAVTEPGTYALTCFRREVEVAQGLVHFGDGGATVGQPTTVVLTPPSTSNAQGLLRLTLYHLDTDKPLAERLIFRQPRAMTVDVEADKASYNPGDRVTLTVKTTYGDAQPIPAVVGITVTDDAVLQRIERRLQPPRLPAMALLEGEVLSLMDAHTYVGDMFPTELPIADADDVDETEARAGGAKPVALPKPVCRATVEPSVALDLLMGTQGWRRFVYENPREFLGRVNDNNEGRNHAPHRGFGSRGPSRGSDADLPVRSQAEFDRAERLFGVHHVEHRVFVTGAMARGMPMPMKMNMPEMAMAEGGALDDAAEAAPMFMPMAAPAGAPMPVAMAGQAFAAGDADVDGVAEQFGDAGAVEEAPMMPPPPAVPMDGNGPAVFAGGAVGGMEEDEAEDAAQGEALGGAPAMDMDEVMQAAEAAPPVDAPRPNLAARMKRPHRGHKRARMHYRREFAFKRRPNHASNDRVDFVDTVYWSAATVTNDEGVATVAFDLSDSITSFRVDVDGFSSVAALLGSTTTQLLSVEPFYSRVALPAELTDGDVVDIPVSTVLQSTDFDSASVSLVPSITGTALRLDGEAGVGGVTFNQNVRSQRTYLVARAVAAPTSAEPHGDQDSVQRDAGALGGDGKVKDRVALPVSVSVSATATPSGGGDSTAVPLVDRVVRESRVMPAGFPQMLNSGGMVHSSKDLQSASWSVTLPDNIVPGSLRASATVYPTPIASISKALESLIRRPCGCFEQTSATTYPLAMAAQYFQTHSGVDPDLLRRSREMLDIGYKKLLDYESEGGGFEWFGGSPGHEALTAYGALQFEDMAKVMPIDDAMLQRTREWLLSRRDEKGGFLRNPRALDSFGRAPEEITNAYIVWALTGTSLKDKLTREVDALAIAAGESEGGAFNEDPYFLGLVAGALYNTGATEAARHVAERIVLRQASDGHVEGSKTSITSSRMLSLDVEATSIAILAWLHEERFAGNVRSAVEWLAAQCQDGGFGSTQGTVLALKAIIAYDLASTRPPSSGKVALVVNSAVVDTVAFSKDTKGAMALDGHKLAAALSPGQTAVVELQMTTPAPFSMPYSLSVEFNSPQPASVANPPITIATMLSDRAVGEGSGTELRVTVTNTQAEPQAMVVAQVGIPSGLELRVDKLDELVGAGQVAFYETQGRTLNLYWRGMAPQQSVELLLDVVAIVPGTFRGDASRVFPYYAQELTYWVQGVEVQVRRAV